MAQLLHDATHALAHLDADALGAIEQRAVHLQALLAGERIAVTAEIAARHRVFASVVRSTGESLRVLEGVPAHTGYGRTSWAR